MKKTYFSSLLVILFIGALFVNSIQTHIVPTDTIIQEYDIPLSPGGVLIYEQSTDISIIPDKYNTGAIAPDEGYTTVSTAGKYNNINIKTGNDGSLRLDFAYSNKSITGIVEFENYDFSSNNLMVINEGLVDREIILKFKNCVFSKFTTGKSDSKISYIFDNCSFNVFYGSNATFDYCRFGGTYSDALNPFRNVSVNNCYFCDMSYPLTDGIIHTDGTQIYGANGIDVVNISYENCRFEIPQLSCATSSAYINACLMVQLEYSDANSISFSNCIINGGGYSIYANNTGRKYENVSFDNIKVGCLRRYGHIYPNIADGVEFNSITDTDSLYVGTVSRDESSNQTYISVTNDTNQERSFRVYTSSQNYYDFTIAACPLADKAGNMSFSDFPFDVLYTIPEYCDWLVCYEITNDSETQQEILTQIRFKNWTNENVLLNTDIVSSDNPTETEISPIETNPDYADISFPISGTCGKNISYTLTESGELTLSGTGNTDNYSSLRNAPWYEYRLLISSVNICDGITTIGSQLFKNCENLTSVTIPEGVTTIKSGAFNGCKNLTDLSLPVSLTLIENYAFWETGTFSVTYSGNDEQRFLLKIGDMNTDAITDLLTILPADGILAQGNCGNTISWELNTDGQLSLSGTGSTYHYSSSKNAPWFYYRDSITSVQISDGIISLGNQLFRSAQNLTSVTLPDSLTEIGANTFINCTSLQSIHIPASVISVGNYCFHGSGLKEVYYDGTYENWSAIQIGFFNAPFNDATLYTTDSSEYNIESPSETEDTIEMIPSAEELESETNDTNSLPDAIDTDSITDATNMPDTEIIDTEEKEFSKTY